MQNTLRFTVPGDPRGKGRPRFSTRGGFARAYTDAKTVKYESKVKEYAIKAGATPREEACTMTIDAYFSIPKSYSKKIVNGILSGEIRYTKKPDTDNISKVKDALNKVAFLDDCQVDEEHIRKMYTAESPRLEVVIVYG